MDIMYGIDSRLKLGDQLKNFRTILKHWGKILKHWGNRFIISRVLRILASQNRCQSLYDEIFNIDKFVE